MIVDRTVGRVDSVVVRDGRVILVSGSTKSPYAPPDAIILSAPAGAVAPGMIYDHARQVFLQPDVAAAVFPRSRFDARPLTSGIPVVAAVPAVPSVPAISLSIENHNSAGGPPLAPVASPGVSSAGRPLGEVPESLLPPVGAPAASSEPAAPGSGMPHIRAVSALRGLQVEAWPPERERYADLAAAYLSYNDPALVPDLVAIVPPGSSIDEVARIALEARETAQQWILAIGRLIDAEAALVVTEDDADRLIARGRAIVEGS